MVGMRTRELRRSQATLQAVFDSASDGIVVAGAEDGRFVMANAAFCRMLGCSPGDIPNLSMSGYPDDVFDADAAFLQKPVNMAALCAKIRTMLDAGQG